MNPDINMRLKLKIIEKFISQTNFAMVLGVDEPYVSRVVNSRKSLPDEAKKIWADTLECEIADIFPEEEATEDEERTI